MTSRFKQWCAVITAVALIAGLLPSNIVWAQFGGETAISSFVYPMNPQLEKLSLEVEHLADNVLRRLGTYSVIDVERALSPEAIQENALRINYARQSFDEGKQAFEALDLETAQDKFLEAVAFYEQALGYLPADGSYETCLMYMGASAYMQGDPTFAKEQLKKLVILAPDYQPDSSLFLPEVMDIFSEARSEVNNMPGGALEITSNPPAVEVYVDGSYIGVTPITVPNLVAGEHLVVTSRKGYVRKGEIVKVSGAAKTTVVSRLTPTNNFRVLSASLTRARGEFKQGVVGPGISELTRWLNLQEVVLGEVDFVNNQVIVNLALFDIPSRKALSVRQQQFPAADPQIKVNIDRFIETFISTAPAPGEVEVAREMATMQEQAQQYEELQRRKAEAEEPVTKKWWFWTVIGVGGAAVIGGAVVGIMFATKKDTTVEPSNKGALVIQY